MLCIQFGNEVKENNRPTLKANSCKLISISSYMFFGSDPGLGISESPRPKYF